MHSVLCRNLPIFVFFCRQHHPSYKCGKVTDISQGKSILRKIGCCLEKGHLMKNCSVNYQCNKCKGKHNITTCEGPRKHDHITKKHSNPASAIPDNETLTTLNESRH